VNELDIDKAIISALGSDWKKAALTVAKTGDLLSIGYAAVAARMTALIEGGAVIWEGGDLSDGNSWVNARVRNSK
jgi:hypothetical protein